MGEVKKRSKELNKLKKIFKDIEPNKRQTVEKLISNAAFMAESLDDLQEIIDSMRSQMGDVGNA